MTHLDERIARIIVDNLKVKVIFNKKLTLKSLTEGGMKIEVGSRLEIPLWLARLLEAHGIVKVDEQSMIKLDKLVKFLWKEENSSTLNKLQEDFYARVGLYKLMLRETSPESITKLRERQQLKLLMDDILRSRLQKILQAVRMNIQDEDYVDKLTFEERILHVRLNSLLRDWRNMVSSLIEGTYDERP